MPELKFARFSNSSRIRRAADNSPPMKPGEPDRAAVKILQEGLIQAGFNIPDGATGFYGPETAAAVQAVERRFQLEVDIGIAGRQVFAILDAQLSGAPRIAVTVVSSVLSLLLQQTNTAGGFSHRGYLTKAAELLDKFELDLNIVDRRAHELAFPGKTVHPKSGSDIATVRKLAEQQMPGMRGSLRVIFCRFAPDGRRTFGLTDGGDHPLEGGLQVPDFILVNVETRAPDDCTLIHEMIHATGLEDHDDDPTSVFSETSGAPRTVLKPEHAKRLSESFFATRRR